jgi:TRAP transporter 4TM/12TM fusion protein
MADSDQSLDDLSAEDRKKVQELMEKDQKSERRVAGPWLWLTSSLAAAMVLLYFYGAGFQALGTQYHLGIYVLITFVLVFLLYPAGGRVSVGGMSILSSILLSVGVSSFLLFDSPAEFYAQINTFRETWEYDGLDTALANDFGNLRWTLMLIVPFAAVMLPLDQWLARRFHNSPTASDVLMAVGIAVMVLYWMSQFEALNYRAGAENELDKLVSIIGLVLSLEICRRVLGWSLTIIGILMLCFGLFGPHLPEIIAHRGFSFERLATALFITTNGVFGIMASVLATYVILFIFFGAFLMKSGAGRFFIDLPLVVAGKSAGGPAKVAVISSALFGSVSGSAIANTVSSGAFTIPMMKRAGFRPHVAGAIEPAASIGGAFLPPIMGAGGFLMAELTGLSYANIMLLAIGPALLYFLSVFFMVHFEAKKRGLIGMPGEALPDWRHVLKTGWYFSLPLVIITVLMMMGRSPGNAAFWATLSCIALSWVNKETRMGPKDIWEAIQIGAKNTLVIGATMGVIGIIVGTISLTGMGLKFADLVISLAGDNMLIAIGLVAIASLILGLGVPVTAAYLILAVLSVPALGALGLPIIAGHMVVYWLAQSSNITPPVCLAAFAGAAIAGSDPWKTGWTSMRFSKMLFVTPLLFAYIPAILLDGNAFEIGTAYFSAILGTIAFGALAMGYLRRNTKVHEWVLLAGATFLLYWPSFLTDGAGLAIVALVWWLQRDAKQTPAPAAA